MNSKAEPKVSAEHLKQGDSFRLNGRCFIADEIELLPFNETAIIKCKPFQYNDSISIKEIIECKHTTKFNTIG